MHLLDRDYFVLPPSRYKWCFSVWILSHYKCRSRLPMHSALHVLVKLRATPHELKAWEDNDWLSGRKVPVKLIAGPHELRLKRGSRVNYWLCWFGVSILERHLYRDRGSSLIRWSEHTCRHYMDVSACYMNSWTK
jgi:hypothetical protein